MSEKTANSPPTGDHFQEAVSRRREFGCFSDEDAKELSELDGVFTEHAESVVDRFYAHVRNYDPTRSFLEDPAVVERLKASQVRYLRSLTAGRYDAGVARDRIEIGWTHERIGLEPEWFVGTYGLYLSLLFPLIRERFKDDTSKAVGACAALAKLMFLDSQFVLDAYYEVRQQRAVDRSRQLAELGELAASIAHEVRNPLAGMKGALNMLHDELSSKPSNREIVVELLAQIDRLETLVRDLLSYARPRVPDLQEFDLHGLLERLVRTHREQSDAAGITVKVSHEPGTTALVADEAQMEQALLNLLHNALQALGDGGNLTIATRADADELTIDFRDTGRGITDDTLPNVLKPFFTTKHRGSGLGLPIVNGIVEAHGGTLEIRSREGRGTTVSVVLPRGGGS